MTNWTERYRPNQRKGADPLLLSIVNIETTAPLFSLWNMAFVLLALLDHAPPLILAATTDRPAAVLLLGISEHEPSKGGLCSPN